MVLNRVERGDLTGEAGAALVGLSLRQVRRLLYLIQKGVYSPLYPLAGHYGRIVAAQKKVWPQCDFCN